MRLSLLQDYNPNITRRELTSLLFARFFNLFAGHIKFETEGIELTQYEKAAILDRFWEYGSFIITEAKGTKTEQSEESSPGYVFLPFSISKLSIYQFPLIVQNLPLEKSAIVDIKKKYVVGTDCALVFWSPFSRRNLGQGVKQTARKYINQLVKTTMTINTNLLIHKMPFLVDCDEHDKKPLMEALRQIFSDFPAVSVPSKLGGSLKGVNLSAPYIIDKLSAYYTKVENQYLDELGIDNAKPLQPGQDRQLLDEVNANNNVIGIFKRSHFDTMNEGFKEAEAVFGFTIKAVPVGGSVNSIHEDINGRNQGQADQQQAEGVNQA